MNKLIILFLLIPLLNLFATSQGTSRNLNIDGNVTGQKGATKNTNGSSWENDELLSGKSGVNWYLSWDNNNLYVGREGGNNGEPMLIYIQAEFTGSVYTDNSSGINYDNTRGNFPTTGSPNWGSDGGVNFVAYIKSNYDEFRTWNGSNWSSANTVLTPQFTIQGSTHNMEVSIPWNYVTQNNGKPNYIRIVFFHTNGQGGSNGSYVYGASPNNPNTPSDGNQTTATFRSWWGGYSVVSGIEPNQGYDGPLPVEIIKFSVINKLNEVKLIWSTSTETQNYGWEIERSAIDKFSNRPNSWQVIGFIKGSGISNSPKEYSFVDKTALYGQYAYRLKQIDLDGAFSYSEELRVFVGQKPHVYDIKAFPNPFNPKTTIRIELPEAGNVKLTLYDVLGRHIKDLANEYLGEGVYEKELDGSNLGSGIYFVSLSLNGTTISKKIQLIK